MFVKNAQFVIDCSLEKTSEVHSKTRKCRRKSYNLRRSPKDHPQIFKADYHIFIVLVFSVLLNH